jgi:hypothetical protein
MSQSIWTINTAPGGGDGLQVVGYKIAQNSAGTGYDFTKPDGAVLASITAAAPPPSFTFPSFTLGLWVWKITVTSLSNPATGSWSNDDTPARPDPDGESGTWTAQAGSGADDDAESATSATA